MNRILWVDDEIDLLQPYIIYLKEKGYEVVTASNGEDAVEAISNQTSDVSHQLSAVSYQKTATGRLPFFVDETGGLSFFCPFLHPYPTLHWEPPMNSRRIDVRGTKAEAMDSKKLR